MKPYSVWCPWSRRSRCFSPSLISASVPRCSVPARCSSDRSRDPNAVDVIRRAYRVLFGVAAVLIAVALCVMALDGWSADRRLRERARGSLGDHRRGVCLRAHDSGRPRAPHPGWYRPQSVGHVGVDELSGVRSRIDVSAVRHRCERNLVCGLGPGRPAHRSDRRHGAGAAPVRPGLVGVFPGVAFSDRFPLACRQHVAVPGGGRAADWLAEPDGFCSHICRHPRRCRATR